MGLIDPYYVVFLGYKVITYKGLPQLWRLVTPFILTGPKLGLLMDPYFLYTYGSQLETEATRFAQPGDFFVYLAFVAVVILVSLASTCPHPLEHPQHKAPTSSYLPVQSSSSCNGS